MKLHSTPRVQLCRYASSASLFIYGRPALVANDVEKNLPESRKRRAACEHAKYETDELLMSDIAWRVKQDLANLLFSLGTCKRSESGGSAERRIEPRGLSMQGRQQLAFLSGRKFADVAVQRDPDEVPFDDLNPDLPAMRREPGGQAPLLRHYDPVIARDERENTRDGEHLADEPSDVPCGQKLRNVTVDRVEQTFPHPRRLEQHCRQCRAKPVRSLVLTPVHGRVVATRRVIAQRVTLKTRDELDRTKAPPAASTSSPASGSAP